jgi:hypothetical protein
MRSAVGGDIDDHRCPQCRQFIENADIIMHKMETIERKMNDLRSALSKYEWTIIENSTNIKNMRKNGMELDEESFRVAFSQTKRFLRLLETIDSNLNSAIRHYDDLSDDYFSGNTMGTV